MIADLHRLAPNLVVVEGRAPTTLWEACDVPSIVVYRSPKTLYLLDTGVGPEQRAALVDLVTSMGEDADELVIVNSHGHYDHLGNNDLIAAGHFTTRRHLITKDAAPRRDIRSELFAMYDGGADYFNYFEGLPVPAEQVASLLAALGSPGVVEGDLADLGASVQRMGLLPALSRFAPSVVVDILMRVYPAVHPSIETMTDLEDVSSPATITVAGAEWSGWQLGPDQPEVHVWQSGGHSAGGVVFYIPEHRFLMLADETSAIPLWPDTDPRRTVATAQKALTMLGAGAIEWLCAGHFPMIPSNDVAQIEASLQGVVTHAHAFSTDVAAAFAEAAGGLTVDELYAKLQNTTPVKSYLGFLFTRQFPVFSSFVKLTLLNHLLLEGYTQAPAAEGMPKFTADSPR